MRVRRNKLPANAEGIETQNFMDSEKAHIIYTVEDIRKYFSGGLTSAEMHAMEKAALEDGFLAEAMDGFGGMPEQDWNKELAALKESFAANPAKLVPVKSVTRFPIWRVAAPRCWLYFVGFH